MSSHKFLRRMIIMYMYRKVSDYLNQWKDSKYRKPLIIQGARQVGKTYAILEFGRKNYDNVAYFNFQTSETLTATFAESISPSYLLPILSHISGQTITRGNTLIVFDEIQLCERAVTSLKYFCEEAPEYHVIAAGSLLGVAVNRKKYAFPVGKVDRYTMYPMDMEEFLLALGEADLVKRIRGCFAADEPMPQALHEAALKLYRQYLAVGGMPEVVARFIDTQDYTQVRHVLETIQMDYLDAMSKYQETANEIKKTRLTYGTVAVQLSKKNTRFQYKIMKTGARAAEYENAIEWLVNANLISRIYRAEQILKPLENYKDIDDFKSHVVSRPVIFPAGISQSGNNIEIIHVICPYTCCLLFDCGIGYYIPQLSSFRQESGALLRAPLCYSIFCVVLLNRQIQQVRLPPEGSFHIHQE